MTTDPHTSTGSSALRCLYLDPDTAGIPWLHDPANEYVPEVLGTYDQRRPDEACDPRALAADIDDALVLICQRHIGIAAGEFAGPALDRELANWATRWRHRLLAERPATWGNAIGIDEYQLRRVLGDSHCNVPGEDPTRVAAADPRLNEHSINDPGPAAEVHLVGDVLCARLRRFGGSPDDIQALSDWAAAHQEHFSYDRIVVDLRGNSGGWRQLDALVGQPTRAQSGGTV